MTYIFVKENNVETKQEFNRRINQLYRQLGKEIYDENKEKKLNRKQKKLIKLIDYNIMLAKRLEDDEIDSNDDEGVELPDGAIVLEPEVNEDGLKVYMFCPNCQTGNNPKSTHCIKCNMSL